MSNINIKDFKQLIVWQKSIELSKDIYRISSSFPSFENFALKSQIIRAACSISGNIAEGNGQIYPKKEISFLNNALGSTSETRNWIVIALQNNYITQEEFDSLDAKLIEITKMLIGYMKKLSSELKSENIDS
jgi:four helix bundle protein